VDIPNPLFSYRWQEFPLNPDLRYFPNYNNQESCWAWNETKRQPDEKGNDQFNVVNENLATSSPLKDQVVSSDTEFLAFLPGLPVRIATAANTEQYRVFTTSKDYERMASAEDPGPTFEIPHNAVHFAIGAIMYQTEYSAFDPLL
jgi:hypothetical protein